MTRLAGDDIYHVGTKGRLVKVWHVPLGLVAWSADWDEFAFETSRVRTAKDGAFSGKWVLEMALSLTGKRVLW